jgi:hypothetical protein
MMIPTGSITPIKDSDWTHGLCSTFAAGLKRRFGGTIWAVINRSRRYGHDELYHAYCVIGAHAYDADGAHEIAMVSDTSRWPIPDMDNLNDVIIVWECVDETWLDKVHIDYNPDDFKHVDDFIDRHPWRFPGNAHSPTL